MAQGVEAGTGDSRPAHAADDDLRNQIGFVIFSVGLAEDQSAILIVTCEKTVVFSLLLPKKLESGYRRLRQSAGPRLPIFGPLDPKPRLRLLQRFRDRQRACYPIQVSPLQRQQLPRRAPVANASSTSANVQSPRQVSRRART